MTNKECFIEKMDKLFEDCADLFGQDEAAEKAMSFYESLKSGKTVGGMTEKGQMFLTFMQENKEQFDNRFKAADIAEGVGVAAKSVAGSMRKLVADGYVKKTGDKPSIYSLVE